MESTAYSPVPMSAVILLSAVILCVMLCSCVSFDITYHNADGKAYTCRAQGYGISGSLMADSMQKQCAQQARQAGYN